MKVDGNLATISSLTQSPLEMNVCFGLITLPLRQAVPSG